MALVVTGFRNGRKFDCRDGQRDRSIGRNLYIINHGRRNRCNEFSPNDSCLVDSGGPLLDIDSRFVELVIYGDSRCRESGGTIGFDYFQCGLDCHGSLELAHCESREWLE